MNMIHFLDELFVVVVVETEDSLPCNVVMTDIEKDEEAVIVRCVGLVCSQHGPHFFESHQVDDVNVDFLCDGRGVQWILDAVISGPGSAVHIQKPAMGKPI